tara:strand:+ start:484 stop:816 length:333 start_codon:yes stop_codon:yes gene_type:complete
MSTAEPRSIEPATVFAALGDPTRLALVRKLCDGQSRSIATLAADTELTRQAVTKHLAVMEDAGLVASERVGRESRYAFRPDAIEEARACLDAVSRQWDDALMRLKRFVED